MKKFFTMAIIAMITLTSCSEDSELQPTVYTNNGILLKKAIIVKNNEEPITANYTYNGTNLIAINYSDGKSETYTYENNLPIKTNEFLNSELTRVEDFIYYTGTQKLRSFTTTYYMPESTLVMSSNYSYELDGDIILENRRNHSIENRMNIKVIGSNISNISISSVNSVPAGSIIFTYDTKNNPLRNITANNIIALGRRKGGANNIANYYQSIPGNNESSAITYTYNMDNFPETSTETKSNGDIVTVQYFYE